MKLRIIFLKKRLLYLIPATIIMIFVIILFLYRGDTTIATFDVINDNLINDVDLTGDGIKDIFYVKILENRYNIEINTKGKSLMLNPSIKVNTLGDYCSYWPMHATFLDINRDKIPEIFLQSSNNKVSLQHVFIWRDSGFKDIYYSSNNILGFIDSHNNKTPKYISGVYSNNGIYFNYYILLRDNMEKFSYDYRNSFLGKDTIFTFINYISTLPGSEKYMPKDIFYPGMTGNELTALGKMSADKNVYKFNDAVFMDTKWDKKGDPTEVTWTLNFTGNQISNKEENKVYSMKLLLRYFKSSDDSKYCYKIYKIVLNN